MLKKIFFKSSVVLCIALFCAGSANAFTLLTKKEALTSIFGESAKFAVQTRNLEGETLARVKERLGGSLVDMQEGSESAAVEAEKEETFYFAVRDGKKIGVAYIDTQPGKWGPVTFIIAMDFKPSVRVVKVMSYEEKRGRPIARSSYMQQYEGKTTSDPLAVGKDITGISGATISSKSATFAVKKALVLFEELYLKK